jgi:hypothetical protein
VSLIVTDEDAAPLSKLIVRVSVPSVSESAAIVKVFWCWLPTTKLPVKLSPLISAEVTPVMVYATLVFIGTLVVANVNVTDPPSSTEDELLDRE